MAAEKDPFPQRPKNVRSRDKPPSGRLASKTSEPLANLKADLLALYQPVNSQELTQLRPIRGDS